MVEILELTGIAKLQDFDDSQREDQADKAAQQQADTKIAAFAALMDFMFNFDCHVISPQAR